MARNFVAASSQYLTAADDVDLSCGADEPFTMLVRARFTTKPSAAVLFGKGSTNGASTVEQQLIYEGGGTDRIRLYVGDNATSFTVVSENNLGSPSTGVWYAIVGYHDPAGDVIGIRSNAGLTTAARADGTWDGPGSFDVGRDPLYGAYFNGDLCEVCWFKGTVLTVAQQLSFIAGLRGDRLGTKPTCYWRLIGRDSPEVDRWLGKTLTLTNAPGAADHPPVFGPRRRTFFVPAGVSTFTGAAAVTIGAVTASGAATFTAPVFTAAGTATTGAATAAGSAEFDAPVYAATGAATTGAATAAAAGTFATATFTGAAAVTIGAVTASGAGVFAPSVSVGAAAVTTGPATAAGAGAFTPSTAVAPVIAGTIDFLVTRTGVVAF